MFFECVCKEFLLLSPKWPLFNTIFKLHNVLTQVLNWEFDNCPLQKKRGGVGVKICLWQGCPCAFLLFILTAYL